MKSIKNILLCCILFILPVSSFAVTVNSISFDQESMVVEANADGTSIVYLNPTISPSSVNTNQLTWVSSNENIATVYNGTVMGKRLGMVTITCSAPGTDGSTKTASIKITFYKNGLINRGIHFFTSDGVYTNYYGGKPLDENGESYYVATVTIPDVVPIDGRNIPVTRIDNWTFAYQNKLEGVVIPETVTELGSYTFCFAEELAAIKFNRNANIENLKEGLCYGCKKLDNVSIPNSVLHIGNSAFKNCTKLKTITFGTGLQKIDDNAFYNCSSLNNISFDSYLETIGNSSFMKCTSLDKIILPDAVTSIGQSVFEDCTSLKTTKFGQGLKVISQRAFYNCKSLDNLIVSSPIYEIKNYAFRYCTGLKNVQFSASLMIIGDYAFADCANIVSLNFPVNLSTIQQAAFLNNDNLTTIVFPSNLTNIGVSAFASCSKLTDITFNTTKYTLNIDKDAFVNDIAIKKVKVAHLDSWVTINFANDKANPASISKHLFDINGNEITNLEIPEGPEFINKYPFYNCSSILSITLPSTIEYVNGNIFYGCNSLQSVTSLATTPPRVEGNDNADLMNSIFQNAILMVPKNSVSAYKNKDWWKRFGQILPFGSDMPQLLWCGDNTTMYFVKGHYLPGEYFNNQKITKVWTNSDITSSGNTTPKWIPYVKGTVTLVVFDSSFSSIKPYSLCEWFRDCENLVKIDGIGNLNFNNVSNMRGTFMNCSKLASIDCSIFNTSNVTDMSYLFYACSNVTGLNVKSFNTSKVENMSSMFEYCGKLSSLDVSGFNTTNVTNLSKMFHGCYNLTTINVKPFTTSKVTNMSSMFEGCTKLSSLDVSGFNTTNVTNLSRMFKNCNMLTSINVKPFNTTKVTDMSGMFAGCEKLTSLDVSGFNTSNVTDMSEMFSGCIGLTSLDLRDFNTGKVSNADRMFYGCSNITFIYYYGTWNISNSSEMFYNCQKLAGGDGIAYNSSKVNGSYANLDGYFTASPTRNFYALWCGNTSDLYFLYTYIPYQSGQSYNGGIITDAWVINDINSKAIHPWLSTVQANVKRATFRESFSSAKPVSLKQWFSGCELLESIEGLTYLNTSSATDMSYMFYHCYKLQQIDLSAFNTSNVINMTGVFSGCKSLTSLNVKPFNTSKVQNLSGIFSGCSQLTGIDVSGFNTSSVTDMSSMFYGCSSLTSLDVSKFNTSKVTNMYSMFYSCSALTSLNVNNFNTGSVTDMSNMFRGCSTLKTIICDKTWTVEKSDNMFLYCQSLIGGLGMKYNVSKVTAEYANPGVDGYFSYSYELKQQSVSLSSIPTMTYGDNAYTLPAKTTQGLTLVWTSSNTSVATISGNTLTIKGAGNATITTTQAGNATYAPFSKTYTLTVNKSVLTVKANDCSKKEGEANPTFTLSYSGFKYNDNESSLTQRPTASTTATTNSPAGTYTITVSGGASNNYTFNYVNGTLTILSKTGDINGDGKINVTDIVKLVDYIMNDDNPYIASYDLNSDGKLNSRDVVVEVDLIMQQTLSVSQRKVNERYAKEEEEVLLLTDESKGMLSLGVCLNEEIVASQCVIELSGTLRLKEVNTDNAHSVTYSPLGDNRYFVVSYSSLNEAYKDNKELLNIELEGEGEMSVVDALLVTSSMQQIHLKNNTQPIATDISSVLQNGSAIFDVYSATGTLLKRNATSIEGLPTGIYIINGKKILIK